MQGVINPGMNLHVLAFLTGGSSQWSAIHRRVSTKCSMVSGYHRGMGQAGERVAKTRRPRVLLLTEVKQGLASSEALNQVCSGFNCGLLKGGGSKG